MFAKRFFFVCAGLLCLAVAYHLGARNATAQATGYPIVALSTQSGCGAIAMTTNGDTYQSLDCGLTWTMRSNVFDGPIPTQPETIGRLKARYR